MAKAAFLYSDLSRAAVISGSGTATGLDWSFLKDPQPRHRARVNDVSAYLILDLGAAVSVDVAALIGTSLDGNATARLRMSASDATVTGSLAYDSTVLTGVSDTDFYGAIIGCLPTPVSARYIRWDVTQASGPIDIGLAPCGLLWRPSRNFSFGGQEGLLDSSQRDLNQDTGAEFGLDGVVRRTKQLTFAAFNKTEARSDLLKMDRVKASGDVLFVEDPDATWYERARDGIWGSFRQPGTSAPMNQRQSVNVFSRAMTLVERI